MFKTKWRITKTHPLWFSVEYRKWWWISYRAFGLSCYPDVETAIEYLKMFKSCEEERKKVYYTE